MHLLRFISKPYDQPSPYFCGMVEFQWSLPCDPTDLVCFRDRIGEEGVYFILSVTADMHTPFSEEEEIVVDIHRSGKEHL